MRKIVVIALLFMFSWAGSVSAGPPRNGTYTSSAGQLLHGRYSESWINGGPNQVGNTLHAASWDGVDLGTQWEVLCPSVVAPPVLICEMST